jgi:hypothetical protein
MTVKQVLTPGWRSKGAAMRMEHAISSTSL